MKRIFFLLFVLSAASAFAAAPYYPGTYPDQQTAPPPSEPPPVVYRRVRPYRPMYRAPDWAYPDAPALGPWPWNFDFGGGPTPVSDSNNLLSGGSNFEFGGGYNFSPEAGFVLEFMNSWLGVTDNALQKNGAIDGTASVWSFTVNPVYRFRIGGPIGGYLIGGGGFYEREMRFREPVQLFLPDGELFGSGLETVRQVDDAGGVNVGAGLTWNMGWGTKFFMEARYHYVFTPGGGTQLIPITFGFRW
jgi:hypothetical protein